MGLLGSDSNDGTVSKTKLDLGAMQSWTRVVDHEAGVVLYRTGTGLAAIPIAQTDLDPNPPGHSTAGEAGWSE